MSSSWSAVIDWCPLHRPQIGHLPLPLCPALSHVTSAICLCVCVFVSIYSPTIIQEDPSNCVKSVTNKWSSTLFTKGKSLRRDDLGNGSFYLVCLWCSAPLTGNQSEGAPGSFLHHSLFDTTRADSHKRYNVTYLLLQRISASRNCSFILFYQSLLHVNGQGARNEQRTSINGQIYIDSIHKTQRKLGIVLFGREIWTDSNGKGQTSEERDTKLKSGGETGGEGKG